MEARRSPKLKVAGSIPAERGPNSFCRACRRSAQGAADKGAAVGPGRHAVARRAPGAGASLDDDGRGGGVAAHGRSSLREYSKPRPEERFCMLAILCQASSSSSACSGQRAAAAGRPRVRCGRSRSKPPFRKLQIPCHDTDKVHTSSDEESRTTSPPHSKSSKLDQSRAGEFVELAVQQVPVSLSP